MDFKKDKGTINGSLILFSLENYSRLLSIISAEINFTEWIRLFLSISA
jgi:hypothetical protein